MADYELLKEWFVRSRITYTDYPDAEIYDPVLEEESTGMCVSMHCPEGKIVDFYFRNDNGQCVSIQFGDAAEDV